MFIFLKKKKDSVNFVITPNDFQDYHNILSALVQILINAGLDQQAAVVQNILIALHNKNYKLFSKLSNSIDMWGGSGAVWEVYIADENKARRFELNVIKLIDLMERTKVLKKGIKSIRKIFENNLGLRKKNWE